MALEAGDEEAEQVASQASGSSTPAQLQLRLRGSTATSGTQQQQLLRRICAQPEWQPARAQTPTPSARPPGIGGAGLGLGPPTASCSSGGRAAGTPAGSWRPVASGANAGVAATRGGVSGRRDPSLDGLLKDDSAAQAPAGTGSPPGGPEEYVIGKQIGQGAYATVFFAVHRETNRKVALKVYEKFKLTDPQRRKSVRCEIRLMERLRHPNIVSFYGVVDTSTQIYIAMEFVGGGSVHGFLKKRQNCRLEDRLAKQLFCQVCQGIRYLHDRHVVHRDLKLENVLLEDKSSSIDSVRENAVKIIDFGFSTIIPPGKTLKIFCGTPSYMAPEIVARKEYTGFCADIWALGVLLYALLCGSFPFRGHNDRELYRKIVRGTFNVPEWVGGGAKHLLCGLLTVDMAQRPLIDEVLADVWLSSRQSDPSSAKASCPGYHPNSSTSSTATTAAPSSHAGHSAREHSREPTPTPTSSSACASAPGGASGAASGACSSARRALAERAERLAAGGATRVAAAASGAFCPRD